MLAPPGPSYMPPMRRPSGIGRDGGMTLSRTPDVPGGGVTGTLCRVSAPTLQDADFATNTGAPVVLVVPGVYSVEVVVSLIVYVCPFFTASGYCCASRGVSVLCVVCVTCWLEPGVVTVDEVDPARADP